MQQKILLSEQFLITCRDLISQTSNLDIFFSQRKLMKFVDVNYENLCKRLSLLEQNNFDIIYWRPILLDAFSKGQVKSKIWLVKELLKIDTLENKTVFILGGWIGILPLLLFWHTSVNIIRNIELDEKCIDISDWLLKEFMIDNFRYKTIHEDMTKINYSKFNFTTPTYEKTKLINKIEVPDIIINTSCDHLRNFSNWWDLIPNGKMFAIQNNNFEEINDHTNIVNSLEEFKSQLGKCNKILYEGELETDKYNRYMIIGIK
ncbi:MAG: hypothetical protein CO117_03900 [Flavobacteriaceae bacterium CG_4_9_14_3_um_filter_33_16]|nr:MAG: hypothetical protein CO117_03900 [Flavobacteriaceae bacterium CG_4_9_14_3_um_filter_33_16]